MQLTHAQRDQWVRTDCTQPRRVARALIPLVAGCYLGAGCLVYEPDALSKRNESQSSKAATATVAVANPDDGLEPMKRRASRSGAGASGEPAVDAEVMRPVLDAAAPLPPNAAQPAANKPNLLPEAGAPDEEDAGAPTPPPTVKECSRDTLLKRADDYLTAMASGVSSSLQVSNDLRYTENGKGQVFGLGLWLEQPTTTFARHILDEDSCSTATEAVLQAHSIRIVFGSRMRYEHGQLLEVETQIVREGDTSEFFSPDKIIVEGKDPWSEPLSDADHRSAEELVAVAKRYFDAASDASRLPPHDAGCRRRQNGATLGTGACDEAPGPYAFQERRFPVVDETTGVVTAIVRYQGYIGMYLIKLRAGSLQNIEVIGGAQNSSTGW